MSVYPGWVYYKATRLFQQQSTIKSYKTALVYKQQILLFLYNCALKPKKKSTELMYEENINQT